MARDQGAYLRSRRSFCRASVGVLIAPGIALAQASNIRRIGALANTAPEAAEFVWKESERLRELGWVEGKNLHVDRRYDIGNIEALQSIAEELVRARVEIIVTSGTPAALAAKRATTVIPIVFQVGDPVIVGLVASLARPGGNLTGVSLAGPEVTAKYLSVMKELLPQLQRIGVLSDAGNPYSRAAAGQFERACQSLGLAPIIVGIETVDEIPGALQQFVERRAQALLLTGVFWRRRFEIVDTAIKNGLPTMAVDALMVREAGALIAYSSSNAELYRLRAEYIDRILRGAKPSDLPVQQPTKFELAINLKTAKALGLTIPQSLLVRADEVIR